MYVFLSQALTDEQKNAVREKRDMCKEETKADVGECS